MIAKISSDAVKKYNGKQKLVFNFLFMKVLKLPMCATYVYEMGHFTIIWPAKYKITSTGLQQLTTVWVGGGDLIGWF